MSEWHGFGTIERAEQDRPTLLIEADFRGTDGEPEPVAQLVQTSRRPPEGSIRRDVVELTEAELRWLVEHAPRILERMGQRP